MENLKSTRKVEIDYVQIGNEKYYKISNNDLMRPFFMSIVSNSNHWMFISSNGGLSAGRKNAEYALFPYYTDDKITESADITGSKSIFRIKKGHQTLLWEPFSERFDGMYEISRNLYKNNYGNKVLFEEINHDLDLTYRYQWNSSDQYGFVRISSLKNNGTKALDISVLDGIQNIIPYGVGSHLQNQTSNLVDAYKRNELEKSSGLGIYALSAIIVDKAEPSEALKANIAWSLGLDHPTHLVSSMQLKNFRKGLPLEEETDVKAEKGAYFVHTNLCLSPMAQKEWMIIADVNKNHAAVAQLSHQIRKTQGLVQLVKQDIEAGTKGLVDLNAAADGLQLTADKFRDSRHFSNSLFNIMRGGIFDNNYQIEQEDFRNYLKKANQAVFQKFEQKIEQLSDLFSLSALKKLANESDDNDLKRLCFEYMPLKFSRRHGDPSRPWNKFSINTRSEIDGSKILDYQGNWRDIFQNWEALALSYPLFAESMIHKFLNASTFDGYNPYRVTKDGFDWETIEPDDPWSYIGYWGDHQIIYLLKLLELLEDHAPGKLQELFDQEVFVYANVPYKIKSFQEILTNPKDTIDFDHQLDQKIRQRRAEIGADGALLTNKDQEIYRINFIEKILATVLAKLSNFIPEGGIWMNTQRPEWNDANNALVGNGVSMVTLYYLRRFLKFFDQLIDKTANEAVEVSEELALFYHQIAKAFEKHQSLLTDKINDTDRKLICGDLGEAASDYRARIYEQPFSGCKENLSFKNLKDFIRLCQQYLEHSIEANKRADNLYHAYNLMTATADNGIAISYLSEMLEGQVAVLSSGYLSGQEALSLLDSLKNSQLFREDQYSYILYPNKNLPGFIEKNTISEELASGSQLLTRLLNEGNTQIIEKDINGVLHFNGNFKNADDLSKELEALAETEFGDLVRTDKQKVLEIFEAVFNHKAFTGRSGTFFGYEGLGSIYWHMVSKLLLAVQEICLQAIKVGESEVLIGKLLEHYYEINAGIGVHKSPSLYGAFPTDPYSHTPAGRGAQQPGMTGQVKEDILSRFGELGVFVREGKLLFNPCLLKAEEFFDTANTFHYVDVNMEPQQIKLGEGALAFTYCQIPVVYELSDNNCLDVKHQDGSVTTMDSMSLDIETSAHVFGRSGAIKQINVQIKKSELR